MSERISERKKALLALKEKILSDIQYYEKCIETERSYKKDSSYFEDDDSDSDTDLTLDTGPSISQLVTDEDMLRTCLHATQELTSLHVLQAQVNVMVDPPVVDRELPVTEEGTWREVTAECRVDLVPFTVIFYAHQPDRLFGPVSYRCLRVQPVKAVHEIELNKSILSQVTTPSDAVEVVRSYALAHRERRTILARLAEKYPNCLFMEPMPDGGYVLKCANLLEVSWSLVNKWSPVAAFQHKMKFNLEYMDEMYVKTISQAYKKLSEPAIEMEERMRLLSRIIATCLEASGPTQELYESMESDIESDNLRKRRTTLDQEIEEPVHKKQKDSDVMAPPKTLPKKTKPKGKENKVENENQGKATKRSVGDSKADSAKKAKLTDDRNVNHDGNTEDSNRDKESVAATKNLDDKAIDGKSVASSKNSKTSEVKNSVASSKSVDKAASSKNNVVNSKNVAKEVVISKNGGEKNVEDVKKSSVNVKKSSKVSENAVNKNSEEINKEKRRKTNAPTKSITDNNKLKQTNGKTSVQNSETDARKPENINKENASGKDSKSNNKVVKNIPKAKSTSNVNGNIRTGNAENLGTNVEANKNANEENGGKNVKTNKVISKNILKAKSTTNVNDARTDPSDNVASVKNKGKSIDRPKSANHKELNDNINLKNDVNLQRNSVRASDNAEKAKESDKNVKQKTKNGVISKNVDKTQEKSNKEVINDNNTEINSVNLAKVAQSASQKAIDKVNKLTKNPKLTNNLEKAVKNSVKSMTSLKTHDTLQKVVVRSSIQSRNSDKLSERNDENDATKNVDSSKNSKNNVATAKNLATNVKTNTINKDSENRVKSSDKTKNNPESNAMNKKIIKTNTKKLQKPQNVAKNPKNIATKSPKQKMVLLNPRNKQFMGKLEANKCNMQNDSQKQSAVQLNTKIPQRLDLKTIGDVIKNRPMRISPRKMAANLRVDSQNVSRSSQSSLQKPITGIPRLMKKPVPKLK